MKTFVFFPPHYFTDRFDERTPFVTQGVDLSHALAEWHNPAGDDEPGWTYCTLDELLKIQKPIE